MEKQQILEARKAIGSHLRELRKSKGLTTYQVNEMTGISLSCISLDETGKNNITLDRLIVYASIYGNVNISFNGY